MEKWYMKLLPYVLAVALTLVTMFALLFIITKFEVLEPLAMSLDSAADKMVKASEIMTASATVKEVKVVEKIVEVPAEPLPPPVYGKVAN